MFFVLRLFLFAMCSNTISTIKTSKLCWFGLATCTNTWIPLHLYTNIKSKSVHLYQFAWTLSFLTDQINLHHQVHKLYNNEAQLSESSQRKRQASEKCNKLLGVKVMLCLTLFKLSLHFVLKILLVQFYEVSICIESFMFVFKIANTTCDLLI